MKRGAQQDTKREGKRGARWRVVFDTSTVVAALLFPGERLGWLRRHWRDGGCTPLLSRATAAELARVLGYAKFGLSPEDRRELLADYLPYCESMEPTGRCRVWCRDREDQPFLDLAESGGARVMVSGNLDLAALVRHRVFVVESPEAYWRRVAEGLRT